MLTPCDDWLLFDFDGTHRSFVQRLLRRTLLHWILRISSPAPQHPFQVPHCRATVCMLLRCARDERARIRVATVAECWSAFPSHEQRRAEQLRCQKHCCSSYDFTSYETACTWDLHLPMDSQQLLVGLRTFTLTFSEQCPLQLFDLCFAYLA